MHDICRLITAGFAVGFIAAALSVQADQLPQATPDYRGALQVKSMRVVVDLRANSAVTSINFELSNPSDKAVREVISIVPDRVSKPRGPEPLVIKPGGTAMLERRFEYVVKGTTLKSVKIDPFFDFSGKRLQSRIGVMNVMVKLPPGTERLIYSSIPDAKVSTDLNDGRTVLTYEKGNYIFTPIYLKWQIATNVHVRKTATVADRTVKITVTVTNRGDQALNDISVSDNFHPGFVISGTPKEEFSLVKGEENDQRLVWNHRIAALDPDESKEMVYEVLLRRQATKGLKFGRTTVTREGSGELLAASERVLVGR